MRKRFAIGDFFVTREALKEVREPFKKIGPIDCIDTSCVDVEETDRIAIECPLNVAYDKTLQTQTKKLKCHLIEIQGSSLRMEAEVDCLYIVNEGWLEVEKDNQIIRIEKGGIISIPKGEEARFIVRAYVRMIKIVSL